MPLPLIFDASEHDFAHKVLDASKDKPVMVDFWADWCPPCRMLTPVLERVTQLRDDVRLAKIEVDENMKLAGRYQLRGFPTVILFRDGEERGRFSGARTLQQVQAFLEQHLSAGIPASIQP
ncbi:MAG TPA: thioredoxin [Burkholderiales bacterium]|nr:thioredoxin [Burkholderiales bacterium]